MNSLQANIFIFNPTCEYSIANGNENWNPNRILQKMEADLSILPLFFAAKTDFILVEQQPSIPHLEKLGRIINGLPNFAVKKEALKDNEFTGMQKNRLVPWGWSPAVHKIFRPLKNSCSENFRKSPVFNWTDQHREITSRKFAAGILREMLKKNHPGFMPYDFVPTVCIQKNDFEKAFDHWGKVMIKAPWSSSGRGLQKITKQPIHDKVWEKLMGMVKEQGYALAEPYLNKKLDLAQQFEIGNGRMEFRGTSFFLTDEKGQYQGNYLNGLPDSIDKKVQDFVKPIILETSRMLQNVLQNSELIRYYEGPLGVDMLVYVDEYNQLKMNPCLEINVRRTMGQLALELEKFLAPGKKGMFYTYYQPGKTFFEFSAEMEKKAPLIIRENKIESGFFALTDPVKNSLFGAYILV